MKTFCCRCGNTIFFENTVCTACGRTLGFDPHSRQLLSFDQGGGGELESVDQFHFKPCQNYTEFHVCNWVLPFHSTDTYCLACSLNQMIPALTAPEKRLWWANMETAKRRLLFTLLSLSLPVTSKAQQRDGLAFAFLEDKRMNPAVEEEYVTTGHEQGLITVNLAEADDANREYTRVIMGETYRTLLGHFRHESGHYYFERLIKYSVHLPMFRHLFGDETQDYDAALERYYQQRAALMNNGEWRQQEFISCYAQAHPLEDWAECWAHYLHMVDTLETATEFGIIDAGLDHNDFDSWLPYWEKVTVALNALNRSMGLRDAYPFVLSAPVLAKIRFVHQAIGPT